jgi:hypothetical protein
MKAISFDKIMQLVNMDSMLSPRQKEELATKENREKIKSLLSGAAGASLVHALSKYMKLDEHGRMAMTTLGFGAGILIYNYVTRNSFDTYNPRWRAYQIDNNK